MFNVYWFRCSYRLSLNVLRYDHRILIPHLPIPPAGGSGGEVFWYNPCNVTIISQNRTSKLTISVLTQENFTKK